MSDKRMELRLTDFFAYQDSVIEANRTAAAPALPLVERALSVAFDATLDINSNPAFGVAPASAWLTMNLLSASMAGLVSATRLALYGDHVGALTLTRLAFEDAYHAEFFRHRPDLYSDWDSAGQLLDSDDRRRAIARFGRKYGVRKELEKLDDPTGTRTRLFNELSTYGVHTNPATTAMRLSLPAVQGSNLGFVSRGKTEATLLVVIYALTVAAYAVSEMHDSFAQYMSGDVRVDALRVATAYTALLPSLPDELSLFR